MANKLLSTSRLAPWNWFRHEDEAPQQVVSRNDYSHPAERLHHEIDRLFDDALRNFGLPAHFGGLTPGGPEGQGFLRPSVDIHESRKHYTITVEVPGVTEEDLKLSLEGSHLVISGEKSQEKSREEDDQVHWVERTYGSFRRVLNLPEDADTNNIDAKFKDGILTIRLGRDESRSDTSRQINIGKG